MYMYIRYYLYSLLASPQKGYFPTLRCYNLFCKILTVTTYRVRILIDSHRMCPALHRYLRPDVILVVSSVTLQLHLGHTYKHTHTNIVFLMEIRLFIY